jgi:hypothetical protein
VEAAAATELSRRAGLRARSVDAWLTAPTVNQVPMILATILVIAVLALGLGAILILRKSLRP